jgi:hypothetical protein
MKVSRYRYSSHLLRATCSLAVLSSQNPHHYNRSMLTCQSFSMVFYVTVSIVIWYCACSRLVCA